LKVNKPVSAGRSPPFGYYGWGTWVGQWQRKWLGGMKGIALLGHILAGMRADTLAVPLLYGDVDFDIT
jgi:hypothetical protein